MRALLLELARLPVCLALLIAASSSDALPTAIAGDAEALEVGAGDVDQLPTGKEADGIIGDFVLRNGKVEATVSGNLPNRKANMGMNWNAPTPGSLYDLAVRGSGNDQLTLLAPGNLEGRVSSVRILSDGSDEGDEAGGSGGVAAVRARRTAETAGGLDETHDYSVVPDEPFLHVRSTWTNHGDKKVNLKPSPVVKGLINVRGGLAGVIFGDAQNPNDRQGYAWASVSGSTKAADLEPEATRELEIIVAPGHSPAEAFSHVLRGKGTASGALKGKVTGPGGAKPATSATIDIIYEVEVTDSKTKKKRKEKRRLPAYPHADGAFEIALPPGTYLVEISDIGRSKIKREVTIAEGGTSTLDVEMSAQSRVRFKVTRKGGGSIPCKAQFIGRGDTPDPKLGVGIQAHGCDHQYHSEKGEFSTPLPPGEYRVVVTHGIEFSHHDADIELAPGTTVAIEAELERVVDTTGWVSTDYHNHSTPSGDNYCGTDDRVINLAAEHIEFAPTTEHNRLYDWASHIKQLGLKRELATVVGIELTGPNAHFNSFPLKRTLYRQDGGAPTWVQDPRINAIMLRDFGGGAPERWVQINHPAVGKFFRDRDGDGVADGGYPGLELLVDAAEVWSTEILNLHPKIDYVNSNGEKAQRENRTFAWLQLLNQGRRMWCVSVSDAHAVFGNGVGGWRTYVPSSTDRPDKIDHKEIIRNSKAGRMLMTNGPFLEVELDDGTLPGGFTRATGSTKVKVKVQTTTWVDVDRVQILVNGRAPEALNFTREKSGAKFKGREKGPIDFESTIDVPLPVDTHIIVAAVGESSDLRTGYGRSWQSRMHPVAFTNPIFVDADGDGFRPNGDTLGFPLPTGK